MDGWIKEFNITFAQVRPSQQTDGGLGNEGNAISGEDETCRNASKMEAPRIESKSRDQDLRMPTSKLFPQALEKFAWLVVWQVGW